MMENLSLRETIKPTPGLSEFKPTFDVISYK